MSPSVIQILLVDDDQVDQEAVVRLFQASGTVCNITVAHDGLEALKRLRGAYGVPALERPYIVLLDLNLPQMDGFSVLKKIRADPDLCDIPVFALTTSTRDDDKAAAYELGVVAYLPKGLLGEDCEDLVSQVKANWSTVPTHAHTSLRRTFDQSSAK